MASLFWTQRQDIGPTPRFGHALAYDADRQRTLLIGGDGLEAVAGDTWLWDGEAWTEASDIGPSARADHAVAFDTARSRVVLFGGRNGGALGDTWEWDGTGWTQVQDSGPAPRSLHALAYDTGRSRVLLFGGAGAHGELLGDTWTWDGADWTQVADAGPTARAGHAMSCEAQASRVVLFGGSAAPDTWAWDGGAWSQLNDVGPAPCSQTALVSTGAGSVLFGGVRRWAKPVAVHGLTWQLSGRDWTERQDMGPSPRHGHAMSFDPGRGRVVLFGGTTASDAGKRADLLGDTWELPVAADTGVPGAGQGPVIADFRIDPGTASAGTDVVLTILLDRPATVPVTVDVKVTTPGPGLGPLQIMIPAGLKSGVTTVRSEQFAVGVTSLTAWFLGSAQTRSFSRTP